MKKILFTASVLAGLTAGRMALAATTPATDLAPTAAVDCGKYTEHVVELAKKKLETTRKNDPRNDSALKSLREMQMKSCTEKSIHERTLSCAMTVASYDALGTCAR